MTGLCEDCDRLTTGHCWKHAEVVVSPGFRDRVLARARELEGELANKSLEEVLADELARFGFSEYRIRQTADRLRREGFDR